MRYVGSSCCFFVCLMLATSVCFAAETDPETTLETTNDGLQKATFKTNEGSVILLLPADLAAGDRFSGTVITDPVGKTVRKRGKSRKVLVGYVVELDARVSGRVAAGRVTMQAPGRRDDGSVPTTFTLSLRKVLKDKLGATIGSVEIPLHESIPPNTAFRLPGSARQAETLLVTGPFDGDMFTSNLRVGGSDAIPIAESPRVGIFRSPYTVSGKAAVALHEKHKLVAEGELESGGVRLSKPDPSVVD